MSEPAVTIYSKVPCPYCIHAKNFLAARNIPYKEIDMTERMDEAVALKEKLGWATFPMILIHGKLIGGFTDLRALEENGKLEESLKG